MNAARRKLDGVFIENRQPLVRMLIGFVGSATTAEDLAQEVYVRVLVASSDRKIDNLRAFLYRTARNLAVDHLRARERRTAVVAEGVEERTLDSVAADWPSPEKEVHRRQLLAQLERILGGLTQRQRNVLLYARVHGYSYGDIARRLDVSTSTVQKDLKLAQAVCLQAFLRADR